VLRHSFGPKLKEIATTIGEMLGVPTNSIPLDELNGYFGFLGGFISLDTPCQPPRPKAAWLDTCRA
jgi:hypothetical protein